jgi:hypothetical protein
MMGNGIAAGFVGNQVWFSEPYRMHAWPAAYALSVEHKIVGLGVVNQSLVICTLGNPVTATGVNPAFITTSKFAAVEPCQSRGSIISSHEGVYYAGNSGLILVNPGRLLNITEQMVKRDVWQQTTKGAALRAARFNGAYYAYGSVIAGAFDELTFDTDSFTQEDISNALTGILVDPVNQTASFSTLLSANIVYGVFGDFWTGELMLVRNGGMYWVDQGDAAVELEAYVWTSKIFQTTRPQNFAALQVFFDVPVVAPSSYGTIKVYANGSLKSTQTIVTSGGILRLPSGFKASFWQIKLETALTVLSVHMATSTQELYAL